MSKYGRRNMIAKQRAYRSMTTMSTYSEREEEARKLEENNALVREQYRKNEIAFRELHSIPDTTILEEYARATNE